MIGAEMSQHMCDVGAETVVMNGYAAQCMLVNKDVRRMDVAQKPDGTPPDMPAKADLLIFEVCPSRQARAQTLWYALSHVVMAMDVMPCTELLIRWRERSFFG